MLVIYFYIFSKLHTINTYYVTTTTNVMWWKKFLCYLKSFTHKPFIWTKQRKHWQVKEYCTFTATWSFAVFLDGPEASYVVPSTSTDIVKTGAWTGPDCDKSLYWSPGLIWFNLISAFIRSIALLSRTMREREIRTEMN